MRRTLYALIGILIFTIFTAFERVDSYKYNYIDSYCVLAVQEMNRSGVPASITLAQAVVESNFGTSDLATSANNHFGIKCKSYWNGDKYYHEDDDYKNGNLIPSCFRSYSSSIISYKDHTEFLTNSKRYAQLFYIKDGDYKSWAYGLQRSGYATDPTYAEKLISAIEKYKLHRFDKIELTNYR